MKPSKPLMKKPSSRKRLLRENKLWLDHLIKLLFKHQRKVKDTKMFNNQRKVKKDTLMKKKNQLYWINRS